MLKVYRSGYLCRLYHNKIIDYKSTKYYDGSFKTGLKNTLFLIGSKENNNFNGIFHSFANVNYARNNIVHTEQNFRHFSTDIKDSKQKMESDIPKITTIESNIPKITTIESDIPKMTTKEKFKKAFKEYGATVIIFHVTISLVSLQICYILISSGIDFLPFIESLGLSSSSFANKIATGASTFVVAYAVHKVFAPIRISITLAATPLIVKYLKRKGILKK